MVDDLEGCVEVVSEGIFNFYFLSFQNIHYID